MHIRLPFGLPSSSSAWLSLGLFGSVVTKAAKQSKSNKLPDDPVPRAVRMFPAMAARLKTRLWDIGISSS
jgi:hypothetical protein